MDSQNLNLRGTRGEDTAVAAMKAGAHDYIMKNNTKRLLPAVARELREARVRREHQRAETERREAEARFRNVLEIAAEGIISVDEAQRILVFNRGAEQIFGYQAEEGWVNPSISSCRSGTWTCTASTSNILPADPSPPRA